MSDQSSDFRRIGNFELQTLLGRGGMGEVYKAYDLRLGRFVALKVMRPEFSTHDNLRQRFHQEAKAIATLGRHPNIITIYEFSADREPYIVMEYISTGSLRRYIQERYEVQKLLSVSEVLAMIQQIASALDYAHQQNIFHRDVKPDNILLGLMPDSDGTHVNAILTDFGLVKLIADSEIVHQTNQPVGTPPYMAPEQFDPRPKIDGRTDIYSLGVMFYELIAGQRPFSPKDIFEAQHLHKNTPPPHLNRYRPGLPPRLIAIIMKCLAKNPNERYQTGRELIMTIRDFESSDFEFATRLDEQVSAQGRLDTLDTYLASIRDVPQAHDAGFSFALGKVSEPQLLIQHPDGSTSVHVLKQDTIMIGRSPQADLILPDKKVSNRHATVTWNGSDKVTIADNNSTNFTFLDGVKLLSHVPQEWSAGQIASIGPYRVILQLPTSDGQTEQFPAYMSMHGVRAALSDYRPLHETPTRSFTLSNIKDVAINFTPPHLVLEAGGRGDLFVTIANKTSTVEHYKLVVDGLPPEWITLAPDELHLMPNESGTITVSIFIPRHFNSEAGKYDVVLRALKGKSNEEIGFARTTLTIQPYFDFRTDIEPLLVRQSGLISVIIHNRGNSTQTYTIVGRDPSSALTIQPREKEITVANGGRETCEFRVQIHQDLNLNVGERVPVVMRIMPPVGEEQSVEAKVEVMGRKPDDVQSYQVITPDQQTVNLSLRTDMIAMHLKAHLIDTLNLPQGDYTLINGKTGDPLLPGQTLPEAGIQRGGVLWVKREISTQPEPEPITPTPSPPPSPSPYDSPSWAPPQSHYQQSSHPPSPYYRPRESYAPPAHAYEPMEEQRPAGCITVKRLISISIVTVLLLVIALALLNAIIEYEDPTSNVLSTISSSGRFSPTPTSDFVVASTPEIVVVTRPPTQISTPIRTLQPTPNQFVPSSIASASPINAVSLAMNNLLNHSTFKVSFEQTISQTYTDSSSSELVEMTQNAQIHYRTWDDASYQYQNLSIYAADASDSYQIGLEFEVVNDSGGSTLVRLISVTPSSTSVPTGWGTPSEILGTDLFTTNGVESTGLFPNFNSATVLHAEDLGYSGNERAVLLTMNAPEVFDEMGLANAFGSELLGIDSQTFLNALTNGMTIQFTYWIDINTGLPTEFTSFISYDAFLDISGSTLRIQGTAHGYGDFFDIDVPVQIETRIN